MKKILILLLMVFSIGFATNSSTMPINKINSDGLTEQQAYTKLMFELKVHSYNFKKFTTENLEHYLELKGINHAKKIMAQAVLETAWFRSSSFKKGNNLFGMKLPKCRETTATGSYLGHAKYNHWTDSVDDYLLWVEYWKGFGYDHTNHYNFLDDIGYAVDPAYNNKLRWIERRLT